MTTGKYRQSQMPFRCNYSKVKRYPWGKEYCIRKELCPLTPDEGLCPLNLAGASTPIPRYRLAPPRSPCTFFPPLVPHQQYSNVSPTLIHRLRVPSYRVALSMHHLLANVLRYVRYMLSSVRLSVVCLLSVTLVHPTQAVELFGNYFSPYDSSGTLLFWCRKSLVGDAPFPLKFAFKVTHPL